MFESSNLSWTAKFNNINYGSVMAPATNRLVHNWIDESSSLSTSTINKGIIKTEFLFRSFFTIFLVSIVKIVKILEWHRLFSSMLKKNR